MAATSDFDEARDDLTLPTVVYVLYLLGLFNGLTVLIGLVIAYANRDSASPRAESHYQFQIRSVWIAVCLWFIGFMMLGVGIPLIIIVIGIPIVMAAGLLIAGTHIWFALRCVMGLIQLSRHEPYPRPRSWLV